MMEDDWTTVVKDVAMIDEMTAVTNAATIDKRTADGAAVMVMQAEPLATQPPRQHGRIVHGNERGRK